MSRSRRAVQIVGILVLVLPFGVRAAATTRPASKADQDALPPKPDFKTRVDYVGWYKEHMLLPDDQNAYQSYVPLHKAMEQIPDGTFDDMFNGSDTKDAFMPWEPAGHKKWEKSLKATQPLVGLFGKAAQDPRPYTTPILFDKNRPEEQRMMMNLLLPNLSYCRTMTKAVLARSWRAEKGVVPPVQMYSAWKTCLGNVRHLAGANSLIEMLVAISERNLVEENARWALYRGVFRTSRHIETAYTVLCESDLPLQGTERFLRMEYTSTLDLLQLMFLPDSPGGKPEYNVDRFVRRIGLDKASEEAFKASLPSSATLADGQAAVRIADECCQEVERLYRTGYPKARAADVEQVVADLTKSNPLLRAHLLMLSKPYQQMARAQTSRRATLLVYAVHLYKAKNGDWPASLDKLSNLPPGITIDPFTGSTFAYHLSADGPRIYSCSENGKDDGGVHSKDWGDKNPASDDYVFWPPQK